jgi:hypothetical protein
MTKQQSSINTSHPLSKIGGRFRGVARNFGAKSFSQSGRFKILGSKASLGLVAPKFWGQKLLSLWSLQNFGVKSFSHSGRSEILGSKASLILVAPNKSPPTSTFSKQFQQFECEAILIFNILQTFFQLSTTFTQF